jgi:hypothetical protein
VAWSIGVDWRSAVGIQRQRNSRSKRSYPPAKLKKFLEKMGEALPWTSNVETELHRRVQKKQAAIHIPSHSLLIESLEKAAVRSEKFQPSPA